MDSYVSEHGELPLTPIDSPRSWFARLMYFLSRRYFGRTPTAFRVMYGRSPAIAWVASTIVLVRSYFLRLDEGLRMLLQLSVALGNGCTFCADLTRVEVARSRIGRQRFDELLSFESSPSFSEREKAALAYAAMLSSSLQIDDAVFARLKRHFDERATRS